MRITTLALPVDVHKSINVKTAAMIKPLKCIVLAVVLVADTVNLEPRTYEELTVLKKSRLGLEEESAVLKKSRLS
ncbi:hypothetical protein EDD11_001974 [Mortierella claussenii]|nr:hypothetical protein EDD11_001974 [Mortierella claussenii]